MAIDAARKSLVLGRHQHDFKLLKDVPCDVAPDRWISLAVKLAGRTIEVTIDGKSVEQVRRRPAFESRHDRPAPLAT